MVTTCLPRRPARRSASARRFFSRELLRVVLLATIADAAARPLPGATRRASVSDGNPRAQKKENPEVSSPGLPPAAGRYLRGETFTEGRS